MAGSSMAYSAEALGAPLLMRHLQRTKSPTARPLRASAVKLS